jgi:hypothetical protein
MKRKCEEEGLRCEGKKSASLDQVMDSLCALRVGEHQPDVFELLVRSLRESVPTVQGDEEDREQQQQHRRGFELFLQSSVLLTIPSLQRARNDMPDTQ